MLIISYRNIKNNGQESRTVRNLIPDNMCSIWDFYRMLQDNGQSILVIETLPEGKRVVTQKSVYMVKEV